MTTYVLRNGQLVEKSTAAPRHSGVQIITDTMQAMRHQASGKVTDSKSKFRQMTRDAGCVEVGNDWQNARRPAPLDTPGLRDDIRRAISELGG